MQNKKTVKEAVFLVLALIVMIGSRFMPATAGLSKDAWAMLGILWIFNMDWNFYRLAKYDYTDGTWSGFRSLDFRVHLPERLVIRR